MIRVSPELSSDNHRASVLEARPAGIDTYQEPVIYMRADCPVCRSEGFESQSRVRVTNGDRTFVATLNIVRGDWLGHGEAGLSEAAWKLVGSEVPTPVTLSHADPVESFRHVRAKLFGHAMSDTELSDIVADIADRRYSDVQLSAFLAACVGERLTEDEVVSLTRSMVDTGERLQWAYDTVLDKHCVGGLPGNRTTPIVVAVAAAAGVIMPKTSSRAITSPAGTADVMETLTRVDLALDDMKRVVEREGGCLAWGGAIDLSPADDILIRVERALDLDSEAQLVASVLSKKIAAGSTHAVIDIPLGPTAKVRDRSAADRLQKLLISTGARLGLDTRVVITDGNQPVGRGIGPALEARDVLAVLQCEPDAPRDLRKRALYLAGEVLELGGSAHSGQGENLAASILDGGQAWSKFQAICEAQGGMRTPPVARHRHSVVAERSGSVSRIDNRRLAKVAKLAGAPTDPSAGIDLYVSVGDVVDADAPVMSVHAGSPGELAYALAYLADQADLITIV